MAASPAEGRLPVADLGVCDDCAGLTIRGTCSPCESKRRTERVLEEATIRPFWVFVRRQSDPDDGEATITLPDDADPRLYVVAELVAREASIRLARGEQLDFALARLAIGRDMVQAELAEHGYHVCRNTAFALLQDLCALANLKRGPQLPAWDRDDGERVQGAYTYALLAVLRTLGQVGQDALRKASQALTEARSSLDAAVSATGWGKRLDRCLAAAIEHAQMGERNAVGHWLTRRCIDMGLDQATTIKALDRYREGLRAKGVLAGYTERETQATVRSAYRRTAQGQPKERAW